MKSLVINFFIILLLSISATAQNKKISKDEAWIIVQKEVLSGRLTDMNVYISPNELSSNTIINTRVAKVTTPGFSSWFFFVDTLPTAKWGHPCNFVFVNSTNGMIEIRSETFPPILDEMQELIKFKPPISEKPVGFKKRNNDTKNVCFNENDYAVIISGGGYPALNTEASWNDCSAIYCALVNDYHFADDHIYVIMSDGTSSGEDRHLIAGGYDSSPLDLDGEQDDDIQYSATYSNIASVFTSLGNLLDSEDNLFIYVTDHGLLVDEENREANIILWDPDYITDAQFADLVDLVDAGRIIIEMNQCYSGAFIDDLAASNRVITTACNYDEPAYWSTTLGQSVFGYHWTNALVGETPDNSPVDADYNDNGIVSVSEAFYYAVANDSENETPQYYAPNEGGYYLTLSGKIPYITGDNMVCNSSNKTYNLVNYPSNTNVTWTCSENLYANNYTNTSYTVHALSGSSTGFGWVQAYITDPYGNCNPITPITIKYSPWVGIPQLDYISGPYEGYTSTNYNYYAYPYNTEAMATYYWSVSPSGYSNYSYSNYSDIIFWEQADYQISARAENTCGITEWIPTYTSIYSGNRFIMYPNPASDFLTISLATSSNSYIKSSDFETSDKIYKVRIIDNQGNLHFSGTESGASFTIPVMNLKDGHYYIQIFEGKKVTTLKFIKTH